MYVTIVDTERFLILGQVQDGVNLNLDQLMSLIGADINPSYSERFDEPDYVLYGKDIFGCDLDLVITGDDERVFVQPNSGIALSEDDLLQDYYFDDPANFMIWLEEQKEKNFLIECEVL